MTHAVGANDSVRRYEQTACCAAVITACTALVNPILGGTLGVFCLIDITGGLVADHFRFGEGGPLSKIARVSLITLASIGAAFATYSVLTGAAITFTPALLGGSIALLAVTILASLAPRY